MAVAAAGPDRVMLVTDAMAASGMPDGEFRLGGRAVGVREGQARLITDDGTPGTDRRIDADHGRSVPR